MTAFPRTREALHPQGPDLPAFVPNYEALAELDANDTMIVSLHQRIAELERENNHLRQYEDRGDFLVYRHEWDELAACVNTLKDALVVMNARAEGAEATSEAAEQRIEKLEAENQRLRTSAWPKELHAQYLAVLDERDALQQRIEKLEAALRSRSEDACECGFYMVARAALRDLDATEGQT